MRQTHLIRSPLKLAEFFFIFHFNGYLALPLVKPCLPPLLLMIVSVLRSGNCGMTSLSCNFALTQRQVSAKNKNLLILEFSHLYVSTVCYVMLSDVLSYTHLTLPTNREV